MSQCMNDYKYPIPTIFFFVVVVVVVYEEVYNKVIPFN